MINEDDKKEIKKQRIVKDIVNLTGVAIGILIMCERIEHSMRKNEVNNNEDN